MLKAAQHGDVASPLAWNLCYCTLSNDIAAPFVAFCEIEPCFIDKDDFMRGYQWHPSQRFSTGVKKEHILLHTQDCVFWNEI